MILLALAACQVQMAVLPDPNCTPGDSLPQVTAANVQRTICVPGWAASHRHVTASQKRTVRLAYDIAPRPFPSQEIDHLISLELGGSNSLRNLWPQNNPQRKDKIENKLHRMVCNGRLTLRRAQRLIARDWRRGEQLH